MSVHVRQATGDLVADGRVEEADDGQVEVGVREGGIAPVQNGGDLSAGRVVPDVLGFEVCVRKHDRRAVLIAQFGLEGAPERLNAADHLVAESSAVSAMQFALAGMAEPLVGTNVDSSRSSTV